MNARRRNIRNHVQPRLRRSARLVQLRRSSRIAAKLDRGGRCNIKRPHPSSAINSSSKRRKTQIANAAPEHRYSHTPSLGWLTWPGLEMVQSKEEATFLIESHATHPKLRYGVVQYGLAITKGIGLKGSRKLVQGFAKEPLQVLLLDLHPDSGNQTLSPYHCRVFRTLFTGISRFKHLHFLRISLNGVALDFSKLPSSLSNFRLTFSNTGEERRCLASLATGLRRAKCLRKLELQNWNFDHESMRVLSLGNVPVRKISISGNKVGDDCVDAFVSTWRNDARLEELRWDGSSTLTSLGVQQLLQATPHHPAFKTLALSFQETAQADVIRTVAGELSVLKLRKLSLFASFPHYTNGAAKQQAIHALAQGIKGNHFLCDPSQIVGIFSNRWNSAQFHTYLLEDCDLSFHLKRNRFGTCLLLDNNIAASVWCHVFANCRFDPSVIYSILRERPQLIQCRQTE